MMKNETIISFNNYTKSFKNEVVLNKVNLEFKKGGFYGIIGKNGSGKSILFKAICGFLKPTEGYVVVNGKKIGIDVDFPDKLGAMIEKPGFLPNYSGFENLKYLAEIQNIINDKKIYEVMHLVNLHPLSDKKVKNYSLGMKQRLGIAQAIMENPDIIILDEPMNGLDREGVLLIRGILKELNDIGKTIIITSHYEEDISELCHEVYKIEDGKVLLYNSK
ncbi:ABC transporter ATP-binding protein (plasmid) [Clostridium perfringens]|uniref:ABC transporter ATP-binding protein n=4 Tax=Clostridium perfringens TaxID=1502 RepID=UPI0039EAAB25